MNSKIKPCLTYLLLATSILVLSGCETLPMEKSANTANTTNIASNVVATSEKPKRIKPQMTIEYVTCDPVRAKQLQAEIDARAAKRRLAMQASTS